MSQQVQVVDQKNKNTRMARRLVWVAVVCNAVGFVLWCPLASSSAGAMMLMLLLALVANGAVGAYAVSQGLVFELMIEYKWKKVCQGLGGNFVGQGRAEYHMNPLWWIGGREFGKTVRRTIHPKLRDVQGNLSSWTGVIYPFYGQNLEDFIQKADRIAIAYHVPSITLELNERGLIAIRAGNVPVPATYDFQEF